MTATDEQRPAFVSLGTVVLDELRRPLLPPQYNVPGGSATFSVMGARLVAGEKRAAEIGCIIMAGNDFPQHTVDHYHSWGVSLVIRTDPTRPSTRGLLEYHDKNFGSKTFRYTTPLVRAAPADLPTSFLGAAAFHLLAQPAELRSQVEELIYLRCKEPLSSLTLGRPLLVWEPAPPFCRRDTKSAHLEAAQLVDVFSPNHLELLAFFYDEIPEFDRRTIEACARTFLDHGIGSDGKGTLVVRAGEHGCLVASPSIDDLYQWVRAFDCSVVDATGAGNTFLGAFTFAMAGCGKDPIESARMANIAATFALEQVGLPNLQQSLGSEERWNGSQFRDRLETYLLNETGRCT